MSYLQQVKDLYSMIGQGQMIEAFEKFYHEDIVMIEAAGEVRKGKSANREFENQWLSSIKEMHGGGVTGITSNEDDGITMAETWVESTFQDGTRMKMEEGMCTKMAG